MPSHWRGPSSVMFLCISQRDCPPPLSPLFSSYEGGRGVLPFPIWLSYFWVRWHYQCPTLFSVQLQSLSGTKSYELIVHSLITRRGRVSLIADLYPDSVTFPLNLPLPQAQWKLMFGLSLGGGQTEINQFSSARTGAELGKKFETFPCSNSRFIMVFPCLEIPDWPQAGFHKSNLAHWYAY